VISGLVFANHEIKNETSKKSTPKPLSAADMKAGREAWEATADYADARICTDRPVRLLSVVRTRRKPGNRI
jgi:hypothetical protein